MKKQDKYERKNLEKHFRDRGILTAEALARARASEAETGQPFSSVLVNLGLISADKLADAYAAYFKLARLDKNSLPQKPVKVDRLSPVFLKANKLLPIKANGRMIEFAAADPLAQDAFSALNFAFGKKVKTAIGAMTDIEEAIEQLYFKAGDQDAERDNPDGSLSGDFERLKDLAGDAPVIKFVEKTIGEAMDAKASDIHLEAMEERFRLRFRIDGILMDRTSPPKVWQDAIISRIKIMAGLNIAERRLPQDGRFKITVRGHEVDFRISTIPSVYGESVVMRLLDRASLPGDFETLGFSVSASAPLLRALKKPDGIVLVTGPTGSGKTTTLYSALKLLNAPDKKILTVEDPVEYMLDGVNQVQVNPKIGRTFASTLRSFLRQDPDILLVGEIRDRETAEIAIQASLTGHLVLSTLHTNNAAGALTRLLDMRVEDYLIASTVTAVVGQRLVRNLCQVCKVPVKTRPESLKAFEIKIKGQTFYGPKGCSQCAGTGYIGRSGIIEVLEVTSEIRNLIQSRVDTSGLDKQARREGMMPMVQYGLQQAALGKTSIEEILRVTREV